MTIRFETWSILYFGHNKSLKFYTYMLHPVL
jgi:hypothetical protein